MKKLITILSTIVLTLSLNAQMSGGGTGSMSGPGPYGNRGMWDYITTAINDLEPSEEKTDLTGALEKVTSIRDTLRAAREANPDMSIETFRENYVAEITALREAIGTLTSWWRENRPDRPDPVVTDDMLQRRSQFQANSQNILQTRRQLRTMDPTDEDYDQVRQQLRQYLGERKQLMRDKRRGEGGPSGEGTGGSRGG